MDIKMKIMNIDLDYMEKESQEGNGLGRDNCALVFPTEYKPHSQNKKQCGNKATPAPYLE